MRYWKKYIAAVLTLALILTGFYISPGTVQAADQPMFYADEVTAEPGSEIEIPIKISGNPGIMGLGLDVKFDKDVLTPVDDTKHSDSLKGPFDDSIEGALNDGTDNFIVLWSGTDNVSEDIELFTLKFKVSGQASGSTEISLTLRPKDTYNESYAYVTVECQPVTVKIESGAPPIEEPSKEPAPPIEEPSKEPEPPIEEPSKEPEETDVPLRSKEPLATGAPSQVKEATISLQYVSDEDWGQVVNGWFDENCSVVVDKNGEYQISFVATAETKDIYRLRLETDQSPENLPKGMKIVPAVLQVGETSYPLTECKEEYENGYSVIVRDLLWDINFIKEYVPVAVGDTVTLKFRIAGMVEDSAGESSPAPDVSQSPQVSQSPAGTGNPAATNKPTAVPMPKVTQKPVSPGGGYKSVAPKKPGKITLKKVKVLGKGKVKVSWKWKAVDGFQLQYAQNRAFTKKKKTKNKNYLADTVTLKKLKRGKTYYFRVRAYNQSGSWKRYGSWSSVKKCKVK